MVNTPLADQWLSLVRVCADMNQAVERALSARHGLCVSAYEIMDVMAREHAWIRLGEVSSRTSRSQPQVSRLVTQMVNEGYVARKPSPGDGRGSQVQLTPAGRKVFQEAATTVDSVLGNVADENADARGLMIRPLPQVG
ncbi:MarR family winged helix-turn-helix transcriptional regulator [Streptomyces sp. 8N706]|uniref:MarR family winged helix-turn-helix transcriptional regulator n=1 Tax=Streptomyces sp. 8N706 TaxID=3457416 RepID=UPI003FD287D4